MKNNKIDIISFISKTGRFNIEECVEYLAGLIHIIRPITRAEKNALATSELMKKPIYYYDRDKGVYDVFTQDVADKFITSCLANTSGHRRKEIRDYFGITAELKLINDEYIAFKNVLLNISTGEVKPFSPDIVTTHSIPTVYQGEIEESPLIEQFFRTLFQDDYDEYMTFIHEIIGYCLAPSNFMQKCFILTGEGGNGKSAFLELLEVLFGHWNVSHLSLADLEDRFRPAGLLNMMLNIGDDIGKNMIPSTANIKKIITGNAITVENKGQHPYKLVSRAKCFFSANEPPRLDDDSQGMRDRILIIPFNHRIRNTASADPHIIDKIGKDENACSYMLNMAIKGLKRIRDRNQFTIPSNVIATTEEYYKSNNPVELFIEELEAEGVHSTYAGYGGKITQIEGTKTKDIYEAYRIWCGDNGFKPLSSIKLARQIKSKGYEAKNIRNIHTGKVSHSYTLRGNERMV